MNSSRLLMMSMVVCVLAVSARAGLQVHLPLDGNLTDVAGGHAVTLTDGFFGLNSYVPGTVGDALRFVNPKGSATTGSSWEIDFVGIDYKMTDEGSVALWFTAESLYNYHTVFANSANPDDWEMWVYGDGRARARIEADGPVTKPDAIAGQTYHIAWTWDRDDGDPTQAAVDLYFDGALVESNTGSWVDPGDTVYFGGGNGNHGANATFDDFRIYDHALSAEEVAGLVPEPSTLALLAMCGLAALTMKRKI
jgi:concanavalin A-like lectin/glucanase superfamily protein/PEP-CTERM motif-containing protein